MSIKERQKLHDYWCSKVHQKLAEQLSDLQKRHKEKRQEMNNIMMKDVVKYY